MELNETIQTKVKELEELRSKLDECDKQIQTISAQKQRVLELALETQGAVKILVELQKKEKAQAGKAEREEKRQYHTK